MDAALLLDPGTYAGLSPADRARVAAAALAGTPEEVAGQDDQALIAGVQAAESAGRRLDAFRIRAAGEVALRSVKSLGEARLSARLGCRNEIELLQRLTRLPYGQLKRRIGLDEDTRAGVSVTGAPIEPKFPRVAGALHQGMIDPGTATLVTGMLNKAARRADPADLVAAEAELVDAATGALAARLAREAETSADGNNPTPTPEVGAGNPAGAGDAGTPGDPAPGENPAPADDGTDGTADGAGAPDPDAGADTVAGADPAGPLVPDERMALVYPEMQKLTGQWGACLDQDGPDPNLERAQARRSLTLGTLRDGLVPVSGWLMPEAAAALQRVFDACLNPAAGTTTAADIDAGTDGTAGAGAAAAAGTAGTTTADTDATGGAAPGVVVDERSPAQKRHDVLMSMIQAAARSEDTPNLGGDTATVIVHVSAEDLLDPAGYACIEGVVVPVSGKVAHRIACTGAVQKVVFDQAGRIVKLGTKERTFTAHQRRAIAARDGGCVIPGCMIPASWCEVHHVIPWAQGGKTTIDNGCLLCWWHHHHIDGSGWEIQMRGGVPFVKAPPWLDPGAGFAPAKTSQTRQRVRMLADRDRQLAPNSSSSSGGGGGGGGSGGTHPPDPPGGYRRTA